MRLRGVFILLLLALLLVGCASNQSGQVSASGPTSLQVVRINTNRYAPQYPTLSQTIEDVSAVQYIYQQAYGLPPLPNMSCPPNTGNLIYRLDFYRGKTLVKEMKLGVLGCQTLSLSQRDVREPTSSFLSSLAQVLHLHSLVPCSNGSWWNTLVSSC